MLEKLNHYVVRVGILLITAALIAGMVGCDGEGYTPPSQNLEIRTWYDLDAVRDNLAGNHTLMNDLNSTTAGYTELASPTANGGKGWQPIGNVSVFYSGGFGCGGAMDVMDVAVGWLFLTGTFDGQGYEIRDLFINRPDEYNVGLFGGLLGVIKNIDVVNATVIGKQTVGGLVGLNGGGSVSNSYSSGNVTGDEHVGGLVGLNSGGTSPISNSYAIGNVSNSYSTGSVIGTIGVGGLVGENDGTVSNSYSTGSVTGNSGVGGLVGNSTGTVSNSFWDIETSGQSTSAGGTGKNTTEMQSIATFSGAGWNIIAVALNETNLAYIWNIVDNVTYPFLSWQAI
jgi:hypothetical protein